MSELRFARRERRLILLALAASLALSALSVWQDIIINSDGVLYLEAARAFGESGVSDAFAIYRWPFYSWLIFLFAGASGIGLENSAHILDALFFALIVFAFIALVRQLGGGYEVLVAAAIVLLAYAKLNEYRSFVVRDAGFWAFYLAAILLFLRNFKHARAGLGWAAAMLTATLFRIEGMVFLLLLPLAYLFHRDLPASDRFKLVARAYVPHLALLAIAFALYWLVDWREPGRLLDPLVYADRLSGIGERIGGKAEALGSAVLTPYSDHWALTALLWGLAGVLFTSIVHGISLLYTALALHGVRKIETNRGVLAVLLYVVALNVLILATHFITSFFLTGRFTVALALVVMLAVPFSVATLYRDFEQRKNRWIFPVVCVLIAYTAVDGFVSLSPSKDYLKEAGVWLKQNTAKDALIYAEDSRISYYAEKRHDWNNSTNVLADGKWEKYDYIAVEVGRKNPQREAELVAAIGTEPAARFANKRNDRVLVFKLQDSGLRTQD
ncbi:MAG: hypothetical protein ACREV9_09850 [Burkholderiales bacterium]